MHPLMPDQCYRRSPCCVTSVMTAIDSIRRTDAAIDGARGSDWAAFVKARQAIADQIVSYLNFCRAMAMESAQRGWHEKAANGLPRLTGMEKALVTPERPDDSDDA